MIRTNEAIRIHEILIEKFGGTKGIRNIELLESALFRPFHTFDKNDLYKSPIEKAAALIQSLLINHPFLDGNKRIGYVLMRLFLIDNGLDVFADEEEKYQFVISIAEGVFCFDDIVCWLSAKTISLNK